MKNANPVSAWLLAFMLVAAGCGGGEPAPAPVMKGFSEYFTIKVGDQPVRMQLAIHPAEQQRGLMFRRDLGPNDGMLFVYERPQQMSFWMRNTPTPLDIGFFDPAGRLQEVYPMYAFDERTVSSTSSNLQYALEMHQGWFRERGVKPGVQIDVKALAEALKARGVEPGKLGLPK